VKRNEANAALFERYGVPKEGATYVFRPDGHVLARRRGVAGEFARQAVDAVLGFRIKTGKARPEQPIPASINQRDRLYDEFSSYFNATKAAERERALARLIVALGHRLPAEEVLEAVDAATAAAKIR
jgi:hypothetical protein